MSSTTKRSGRKRPSLERAIAFLRQEAEVAASTGQRRLPSMRRLCQACGVSLVTLQHAARCLHEDGVLRVVHGRGVELPDAPQPSPQNAVPRRQRWQQTAHRLRDDITRGTFTPGERLPPQKQLCARYGVCHTTLARALKQLSRLELIEPDRRSYRVPLLKSAVGATQVLLVTPGDRSGIPLSPTPRTDENLRSLEQVCSRSEVRLTTVVRHGGSSGFHTADGTRVSLHELAGRADVLGVIVWTIGMVGAGTSHTLEELRGVSAPVAVLDENASYTPADMPAARFRLFATAGGCDAGDEVCRYLVRLGHTRIAYISPVHAPHWSRNRLRGLRQAAASAGDTTVWAFTRDLPFPRERESSPSEVIAAWHASCHDSTAQDQTADLVLEAVREESDALQRGIRHARLKQRFTPLFEQALTSCRATAWVGANDETALAAIEFLQARGRSVPGNVSVVGFDDGVRAYKRKLTSYNFNAPAVMQAMLSYLLRPGRLSLARETTYAPGFISERLTTATATRVSAGEPADRSEPQRAQRP